MNQSSESIEEGPFSAQAVSFGDIIKKGEIPLNYLDSDYIMHQFVERLVHYVLSVPHGTCRGGRSLESVVLCHSG